MSQSITGSQLTVTVDYTGDVCTQVGAEFDIPNQEEDCLDVAHVENVPKPT